MAGENYILSGPEPYVFRDGRPFGEEAMTRGGALRWPLPATLAGMIRSRFGETAGLNFRDPAVIETLKAISITGLWPVRRSAGSWASLHPAPADAVLFDAMNADGKTVENLEIKPVTFGRKIPGSGSDLDGRFGAGWQFGSVDESRKPSGRAPEFWNWRHFENWLLQKPIPPLKPAELGVARATFCVRMHTAIDPNTGSAREGQLFMSQGVRLAHRGKGQSSGDALELGIGLRVEGCSKPELLPGPVYLGGERKVAWLDPMGAPCLPEAPKSGAPYAGQTFLRIILTTPGHFAAGWRPDWLAPMKWTSVPKTGLQVLLRAACIPPWQPASGYDYQKRGPKPTRKLVPAGAVYWIEVKPFQSKAVAEGLWGRSMADLEQSARDGYGLAAVGLAGQAGFLPTPN